MSEVQHIVSNEFMVEAGKKALSLCGVEFRLEYGTWDAIPADKPICLECVMTGLKALTQADQVITLARAQLMMVNSILNRLNDVLDPEDALLLDELEASQRDWEREREIKKAQKAARKAEKQTCTCTWTGKPPQRELNEDCPVHGGYLDAIGVEDVQLPE